MGLFYYAVVEVVKGVDDFCGHLGREVGGFAGVVDHVVELGLARFAELDGAADVAGCGPRKEGTVEFAGGDEFPFRGAEAHGH